jgi:hypothetical protein
LPTLKFDEAREYWAHQEPGSLHAFLLRQGGLGFYQVEMAPIYAKTRKFYDTYQDGQ